MSPWTAMAVDVALDDPAAWTTVEGAGRLLPREKPRSPAVGVTPAKAPAQATPKSKRIA